MTTPSRPQRYTDLIQQIDGQRRAPVVPGSWVAVAPEDLSAGSGISLAKVVRGPNYTHAEGVAIQALWFLHDGREIPELRLTAVDLAELIDHAADVLRWLRNGVHPDRLAAEMLRAHRAAALARRALGDQPRHESAVELDPADIHKLRKLLQLSGVISELEIAWREMVRSRLPNLVRSLYLAGALEISRRAGRDLVFGSIPVERPGEWMPNTEGRPHPMIAVASPADLAAIGWFGETVKAAAVTRTP